MDRRIRKTREAIFSSFTGLLEKHPYHEITVQDIIDGADIGRATFYAHFETKDFLLKEMCEELFGHIIDTAMGHPHGHYHCSYGEEGGSVFLHLLRHLGENDRNILSLLSSQSNDIFLSYFKTNLRSLVKTQLADAGRLLPSSLPEEYLLNHVASSFVETVAYWLRGGMRETAEEIASYFEGVMQTVLC